ncbi:MAG: hypothetical protein LAO06_07505 [Acidobacteriia bacterium]|nr:hypothetical protein [Terriglobia bacterium]
MLLAFVLLLGQNVTVPPPDIPGDPPQVILSSANVLPSAPSALNGTLEPSSESSSAVLDATPANPAPASALIVPIRPVKLSTPSPAGSKRVWLALTIAQHSAATFDAWTTRRNVSSGNYHENNPFLRPFAGNNSLYVVMQITPTVFDLVGQRMRHSNRPWLRRIWWVPQAAQTATHLTLGARNLAK